ncbi:uncharacterized protein LOC135848253 isoform X10 [Planococcus citri]|uniref:uncharacterized protein LOC135848253 isoform X10 n=1 Tax=Planococcus citri TaxID=170843 RepID=UPI0031F96906
MCEIITDVYDLINPTPVSLKQLSAISVSLEIWRHILNEYRKKRTKISSYPRNYRTTISSRTIDLPAALPCLPAIIYDVIDKYIERFELSLKTWLWYHYKNVFFIHNSDQEYALKNFDDFVCDFQGDIDYVKTAKRMMLCSKFSTDVKFRLACMYCFEEDIAKLWPSLWRRIHYNVEFSKYPEFDYWVRRINNECESQDINYTIFPLHSVPTAEEVFHKCTCSSYNRTSVEYFWNLIPFESRFRKAVDLYRHNAVGFIKFILPKLDDQHLQQFVDQNGFDLMESLLNGAHYDEKLILPTWMYIKNLMSKNAFKDLVKVMLKVEGKGIEENPDRRQYSLYSCGKIWHSAPYDLKRSTIVKILYDGEFFENMFIHENGAYDCKSRNVEFLLTFLSFATSEERNSLWIRIWLDLIADTRIKDLQRMMELCFDFEADITHFKEEIMVSNEKVLEMCVSLLRAGYFTELNEFLRFLYPKVRDSSNFRRKLLQIAFLGEDGQFASEIVNRIKEFNEFVNDAFTEADLQGTDFKIQFISSLKIQKLILIYLHPRYNVDLKSVMQFIETFSSEETLLLMKTKIIDDLKLNFVSDWATYRDIFKVPFFDQFLLWCLGSAEKVETFKLDYNMELKALLDNLETMSV